MGRSVRTLLSHSYTVPGHVRRRSSAAPSFVYSCGIYYRHTLVELSSRRSGCQSAVYSGVRRRQSGGFGGEAQEDDEVDYVYVEALRNVILSGSASISLVQRKCSVGYNKAGKIIEWMEDQGYISAFDGAKARKVLITPEQFEEKYGPL